MIDTNKELDYDLLNKISIFNDITKHQEEVNSLLSTYPGTMTLTELKTYLINQKLKYMHIIAEKKCT